MTELNGRIETPVELNYDLEPTHEISVEIVASGPRGKTGKSAYEHAVEGGYTGTEEDFNKKQAQDALVITPISNRELDKILL